LFKSIYFVYIVLNYTFVYPTQNQSPTLSKKTTTRFEKQKNPRIQGPSSY